MDLALSESAGAVVCSTCKGAELHKHDCTECRATGYQNLSNRGRAREAGIDWRSWRDVWRDRYERCAYPIYSELGQIVRQHIDSRLMD